MVENPYKYWEKWQFLFLGKFHSPQKFNQLKRGVK